MTHDLSHFLENSTVLRNKDDYIIVLIDEIKPIIPENVDCVNSESMDMLNHILERGIDMAMSAAEGVINELVHVNADANFEMQADAYIYAGDLVWRRFVELFNLNKFPAINTNNGEPYLTIEPHGFLFCMMALAQDQRKPFIPAIEAILLDEFNKAMKESKELCDETWTPDKPTTPPSGQYELRDKIFEDSGISELIRTFQQLGTYHPDGVYASDEKKALHIHIEELMNRLFSDAKNE